MKTGSILLALPAVVACGGEPACRLEAMADTTGWKVVDAGPFVFKLPPGYRDEHPIGTDAYAGSWTQGARTIRFAWGPHTADPRRSTNPAEPPLCRMRINGRTALVAYTVFVPGGERRYHVGGWWQKPDTMSANLHLAGSGPAADSAGRAIAWTVLRTVHLRTVWSADDNARFTHRPCEISRVNEARSGLPPPDPDPRNCPARPPPPAVYERVR
ncbi:MAG TPA: hypothetical protein VE871_06455 [Longimicrobium sp.]|nr:hypothetical protein [Longimicrobium sp.]